MNIPTKDPLKPKPRLGSGVAQRSQSETKAVEGQTNAAKIRNVTVSATAPTHGQAYMYSSTSGLIEPTSLQVISQQTSESVAVGSATELRAGNTTIVVGTGPPTGPSASGDIVFSPGAIQRVEMLVNPRAGDVIPFSPTVAVTAPGITTTTQTTFVYTSAGDPITVGMYIQVLGPPENMLVTAVDTATNTLTVQRGRLQSVAATHPTGASVNRVAVQVVMDVNGGVRALGGIATADLSLLGSSTQELKIKAIYTPTPPTPTYVGIPDGTMHLHLVEHDHAADTAYAVEIDGQGATGAATFQWSDDGGATWIATGVATSQFQTFLQNGVTVSFDYGTYMVGTRWDFTAIGLANQTELLRADTTTNTLHLRNIDVSATSSTYTQLISGTYTYTGAALLPDVTQMVTLNMKHQGTNAGDQVAGNMRLITQADRSAGNTYAGVLELQVNVTGSGGIPGVSYLSLARSGAYAVAPADVVGISISDIGHASSAVVRGLRILTQSGVSVINIDQQGTNGVNRLAAATAIGANASPAAGLSLDVTGDAAVSSQLHVGAVTVPAAGVALQLTGGRLRMAASTNDYIETSAGTRILTFASNTTVTATTLSVAGDLRVNDQLGVGGAALSTARVTARGWVSETAASGQLVNVIFDAILGANVTTRAGFAFSSVAQPSFDLAGFNVTNLYGVMSNPQIGDTASTGVVTRHSAYYGLSSYGASGGNDITVTDTGVFYADVPTFADAGVSVIGTQRAFWAKNQGATQVALAIGVDIETQSGATENIGLRFNANFIEGAEMTAPAAPAANGGRVWFQDSGGGKTQLMVEFASGGPIQVAIEP